MPERYDVLVVGAGPAGLAAAQAAVGHGARVGVIDAQARVGGQVWRHDVRHGATRAARRAVAGLDRVDWLLQHQVIAAEPHALLTETADGAQHLHYDTLVLATGARELLLPFPGWTLPGVTGAGGLQALAKQGWPVAGKRVVVAGSGPLLLAAAATLRRHGAHIAAICEQAPTRALLSFAAALRHWPGRAAQAASLLARLGGVPYRHGAIVRAARGHQTVKAVEVETAHGIGRIDCDHLAIGYGLVPNVELAQLLGCALEHDDTHPHVRVDDLQRTSIADVHAAGELCGIGGLMAARVEGAIAGHAAVGAEDTARALRPRRDRARRFATLLTRHFALDPRVRQLATADTLICRCEDVALGALDDFDDARAAKLATRCGMGACQGRICGSALTELGRFARDGGHRPPLFPARLAALAMATPELSLSDDPPR